MPRIVKWNQWVSVEGWPVWAQLSGEAIGEWTGPAPWRKQYTEVRVTVARYQDEDHIIKPVIATLWGTKTIKIVPELGDK